jgi:anti-sigma factor RsiW
MSDAHQPPPDVHPASLLLPWYLSGSLSEAERREVEGHLMTCTACKSELEMLAELRRETRGMIMDAPGPGPRVKRVVMAEVNRRAARPSLLDRIDVAAKELLRPKWAPSFAVLLIICQFGVIAWLTPRPGAPPELTSRSVSQAAARLKIVFSPAATLGEVQSAIRGLGARIVDGPTQDGAYIIELPADSPQQVAAKLRALRERPGLVQRIENTAP